MYVSIHKTYVCAVKAFHNSVNMAERKKLWGKIKSERVNSVDEQIKRLGSK